MGTKESVLNKTIDMNINNPYWNEINGTAGSNSHKVDVLLHLHAGHVPELLEADLLVATLEIPAL